MLNYLNDYQTMLIERSKMKRYVDNFFEKNVINHSNPIKRVFRLNLLALIRKKLLHLGDLNKLEG